MSQNTQRIENDTQLLAAKYKHAAAARAHESQPLSCTSQKSGKRPTNAAVLYAKISLWQDVFGGRHVFLGLAVGALKPSGKSNEFFADGGVDGDGRLKVLPMRALLSITGRGLGDQII